MIKSHIIYSLLCSVILNLLLQSMAFAIDSHHEQLTRDQWLKARFGAQHEKLIPIVAVADMVFSCESEKSNINKTTIKTLITTLDKNALAERLLACLGTHSPKSDTALNYGLMGCFHEQLAELPSDERNEKMRLVKNAIASLSRQERQKSFTQCVTDQSISYLK